MSKDLINIQNNLNQSIKTLCGYLENVPANDRRVWLVPTINNLEEALEEIKLVNKSATFKAFKRLDGCKKHPEEFYMNEKQINEALDE